MRLFHQKIKPVKNFFGPHKFKLFVQLIGLNLFAFSTLLALQSIQTGPTSTSPKALAQSSYLRLVPESNQLNINDSFTAQVFLLPNQNSIVGLDVKLHFDPAYLQASLPRSASTNPFPAFIPYLNSTNGLINFSTLSYDNQPTNPISGSDAIQIANITFKALQSGSTAITMDYQNGQTTDSNISAVDNGAIVDALLETPNSVSISITAPQSPTPASTPTPPPNQPTLLPSPTPRNACFYCTKQKCDGRCHPTREDARCPDCYQTPDHTTL